MAPLAGPSGAGANVGQAPQPAKATRLIDASRRWSAAVKIAGQETEIFKVEHQVGKTTCYIAAEEGKEFEVRVDAVDQPSTDECSWLYVDGTKLNGYVRRRIAWTTPSVYTGKRASAYEIRPFVFAPIALTEDASEAVRDEAVIKGLGTIRLDFYRVMHEGRSERVLDYSGESKQHLVDEKSKKATMSHSTAFGAPRFAPEDTRCHVTWIDKWESPMYSLIFQYRSRALLEIDGIAEPLEAPEPDPAAQDRVSSTSASPAPGAGSRAGSSSAAAGKKNQKRKKIELTLPDSSDEDNDGGGDLRAKIARLEGENARLRGGVKAEPGVKVKEEPKVKKEKYKTSQENGKVVLDLLDE